MAILKSGEVLQHQIQRELVNRPFEFHKHSHLFIGVHKKAASRSFVFTEQLQHKWNCR